MGKTDFTIEIGAPLEIAPLHLRADAAEAVAGPMAILPVGVSPLASTTFRLPTRMGACSAGLREILSLYADSGRCR